MIELWLLIVIIWVILISVLIAILARKKMKDKNELVGSGEREDREHELLTACYDFLASFRKAENKKKDIEILEKEMSKEGGAVLFKSLDDKTLLSMKKEQNKIVRERNGYFKKIDSMLPDSKYIIVEDSVGPVFKVMKEPRFLHAFIIHLSYSSNEGKKWTEEINGTMEMD